ncbi:hypothetical protein [Chlamydia pecorum]|uniref:Lipoprotein, putative n=1 Tax=Chlamydia pecorum (strain ATCC VR-628 / DSM 29919 / E58) TaxID=331635 RepID=A0AA34RD93_CHLPE|nr:hypothetical protein [Chlamydia pecorum]AEB41485.1 lipoprotein, putative [Chlamydia pecorum E58]AGW38611.1 hypothetical protein CPE2_0189 [Chlamydia pecorum W73]AGW39536.1 hypothetical protein CPE3_0189 [Chlamydia pecorum P787]ETF39339.1 lipoprotein [Chlamydia pecorum DBDeUG]ETF40014.1 lipoprotein [Chlamydia pecorum MC/MarsBar]
MRGFSFLILTLLLSVFSVGCSYMPPERSYVLAKRAHPLVPKATRWEFSLAKAILQASHSRLTCFK